MDNETAITISTDDMNIRIRELLSISAFCANPQHYINKISESNERLILTRNGVPIAGLAPLWLLAMADNATRR